MNQLVVASTLMEIRPLLVKAGFGNDIPVQKAVRVGNNLSLLITGVGSADTIFHLTRSLSLMSSDRIIQVGVAGCYNRNLKPGDLVEVIEDSFADLGIDDNGEFVSAFESGIADPYGRPYNNGKLINPHQNTTGFNQVKSISVNTVSGSESVINQRITNNNPDIESMEGAAAFYVCLSLGIPILQVRSISNYVEPRDREAWEMDLAIENLNKWLIEFVDKCD